MYDDFFYDSIRHLVENQPYLKIQAHLEREKRLLEQLDYSRKLLTQTSQWDSIHKLSSASDPWRSVLGDPWRSVYETTIKDPRENWGISYQLNDLSVEIKDRLSDIHHWGSAFDDFFHLDHGSVSEIIERQNALLNLQDKQINYFESSFLPTEHFTDSLAGIFASVELYGISDELSRLAMVQPLAYQEFACHQLRRIEVDIPEIAKRRSLATDLAGSLLDVSESAFELSMQWLAEQDSQEDTKEAYNPNLYSLLNQHIAFAYNPNISVDVPSAVTRSLPNKINLIGTSIIAKIIEINRQAEAEYGEAIFKPTNKSMRACMLIPNFIVSSERDFADIIDHLFFLIYEGSGKAKRIFTIVDKDSSEEPLKPLWRLKHLRLDFRHDLDHGESKNIARKRENISDAYKSLIAIPCPRITKDWRKAQLSLYIQLECMLDEIWERQSGIRD